METLRATSGFTQLAMPMYQYYMNLREQHGWTKVFAFSHELLERLPDFNWVRTSQEEAFTRFTGINQKLPNSGWHFTYLGGAAKIHEKLNAFSHDESWFQLMPAPGGIEPQILAGFEVGNARNFNRFCEIDETYPVHTCANLPKYRELGYIKDPYEALAEMQMLLRSLHESARRDQQKINFLERKYGMMLSRLGMSIEYTKP